MSGGYSKAINFACSSIANNSQCLKEIKQHNWSTSGWNYNTAMTCSNIAGSHNEPVYSKQVNGMTGKVEMAPSALGLQLRLAADKTENGGNQDKTTTLDEVEHYINAQKLILAQKYPEIDLEVCSLNVNDYEIMEFEQFYSDKK